MTETLLQRIAWLCSVLSSLLPHSFSLDLALGFDGKVEHCFGLRISDSGGLGTPDWSDFFGWSTKACSAALCDGLNAVRDNCVKMEDKWVFSQIASE